MSSWKTELLGTTLKTKSGTGSVEELLANKKLVGLYFSAHWCPPCRGFTPLLAEFYTEAQKKNANDIEIVFISSDRDQASFEDYYGHMPWLAIDKSQDAIVNAIKAKYNVRGIPTFIVLDGTTGEIIDASARNTVAEAEGNVDQALSAWIKA